MEEEKRNPTFPMTVGKTQKATEIPIKRKLPIDFLHSCFIPKSSCMAGMCSVTKLHLSILNCFTIINTKFSSRKNKSFVKPGEKVRSPALQSNDLPKEEYYCSREH